MNYNANAGDESPNSFRQPYHLSILAQEGIEARRGISLSQPRRYADEMMGFSAGPSVQDKAAQQAAQLRYRQAMMHHRSLGRRNALVPLVDTLPTQITTRATSQGYTQGARSCAQQIDNASHECIVCMETFSSNELIQCLGHTHWYCKEDLIQAFKASIRDTSIFPPRCCNLELTADVHVLGHKLTQDFLNKKDELETPVEERTYCRGADCSSWVPPLRISEQIANCACRVKTCTICKGQPHPGLECAKDKGDEMLVQLAAANNWKQCYSCKAVIERDNGCDHMTCRCGAELCYVCGKPWRSNNSRGLERCTCPHRQDMGAPVGGLMQHAMQLNGGFIDWPPTPHLPLGDDRLAAPRRQHPRRQPPSPGRFLQMALEPNHIPQQQHPATVASNGIMLEHNEDWFEDLPMNPLEDLSDRTRRPRQIQQDPRPSRRAPLLPGARTATHASGSPRSGFSQVNKSGV